jgi:hypothetical protein
MAIFHRNRRLPGGLTLGRVIGCSLLAGLIWGGSAGVLDAQRALRDQTIFVGVVDKEGRPPASLALGAISVREDGIVREVTKIEPATGPMHIAVLMDTSEASQGSIPDMRDAVRAFGAAIWAKSPDTQIALYSTGERPTREADFTSSPAALGRGVDRLISASGSGSYFVEAVVEASSAIAKLKPARGVVVAYVDENGPEFSSRRHTHAFEALSAARASLWTVTRQGFGNNAMTTENRERSTVIGDVTTRTGGRSSTVFAPSALVTRFEEIAVQLLSQFAVTYGRPETLIPPERLEVQLSLDGYRLTAPRWINK